MAVGETPGHYQARSQNKRTCVFAKPTKARRYWQVTESSLISSQQNARNTESLLTSLCCAIIMQSSSPR